MSLMKVSSPLPSPPPPPPVSSTNPQQLVRSGSSSTIRQMNEEHQDECCVCQESEAPEENPLVYCDVCNVGVHAECYGYPLTIQIPTADWICEGCLAAPMSDPTIPIRCCLCPVLGGALKRTTVGSWCHLSCALWIPEVFFRVASGREAIDLTHILPHRLNHRCDYCGQSEGACNQCSELGCGRAYHITCGMKRAILLQYITGNKNEPDVVISYCTQHTKKWKPKTRKRNSRD